MPQKSGDKGRWENSARKERRAAQFGNSGNGEQRKSFHSDRKFNRDQNRDSQNNRNFRDNRPNNRNNQRGGNSSGGKNNSPVQFTSFKRGR